MQIIIPMSGFGERFRRAGYDIPKPLIELEGKPIIAHVIDMFPDEHEILFICNREHLDEPSYHLEATLRRYCPTGRIVGIAPHKRGPVHTVLEAAALIDPDKPVVVNYCDFTCYWSWTHFKEVVTRTGCAGAIPAYKGFHPHSLGTTNYAYIRHRAGWIEDIREKQPFTTNRIEEYASSGTYYFSSGSTLLKACTTCIEQGLDVGGEYYVSLAYKPLLDERLPIMVYPLQHFMQWGTPEDVAEYRGWSQAFRRLAVPPTKPVAARGSLVIPMAGFGKRFADEGYTTPKPLLPVSGAAMVVQASESLPPAHHHAFVLRQDMPGHDTIVRQLRRTYPDAVIESLSHPTAGQACTALHGLEALERALGTVSGPVTIGACDHGLLYDQPHFAEAIDAPDTDVLVWVTRGHAHAVRHPHMYGWVYEDGGLIRGISVKQPLAAPERDPIVTGTFTFRRSFDLIRAVERLLARDGTVNGEFYLDSCINDALALGLRCRLFEVAHYLSWGTPNDLRTFEYWQSCFHKWDAHPYQLALDNRIPPESISSLENSYRRTLPHTPNVLP